MMYLLRRVVHKMFPNYKTISYSQCGEDIIVNFILENYFQIKHPRYLDIGANHPKKLSNTYFFYKKGCSGFLIEPDKNLFAGLQRARGDRDTCLNIGVSDRADKLKFYKMSIDALNSFSLEESEKIQASGVAKIVGVDEVEVVPLNDVLAKEKFNFVSIDVEGIDEILINAWDFARFRPEVICIESVEFAMGTLGTKKTDLIKKIADQGYVHYADTYINSIFMRKTN